MKMQGEKRIPASRQATWDALNDPEVLKACIPGCESLEATGPDSFDSVVAMRIGPVSAKFKGRLKLSDVNEPQSYAMSFEGQGGVAGFGNGTAAVQLLPDGDDETVMTYQADAQVGGKLAQIGSRLVDAAATKIANQFFDQFTAYMALLGEGGGVGTPGDAAPGGGAGARVDAASGGGGGAPVVAESGDGASVVAESGDGAAVGSASAAASLASAANATAGDSASTPSQHGSEAPQTGLTGRSLWIGIGVVLALALMWILGRG